MNEQLRAEFPGVSLTETQLELIESSLCFIPGGDRPGYLRTLASRLRPIRDLRQSDVAHHVSATLNKLRTCRQCSDSIQGRRHKSWISGGKLGRQPPD
jgi:hypothetical protein